MRWAGHVVRMGELRGVYRVFGGETRATETTWKTQAWMGGLIIRWIFGKWEVGLWTGSIWFRIGTGGGHL